MNFLPGYKTHLLVIGGLVSVVGMFLSGELALMEAVQRALEVMSISALRLGVAKVEG